MWFTCNGNCNIVRSHQYVAFLLFYFLKEFLSQKIGLKITVLNSLVLDHKNNGVYNSLYATKWHDNNTILCCFIIWSTDTNILILLNSLFSHVAEVQLYLCFRFHCCLLEVFPNRMTRQWVTFWVAIWSVENTIMASGFPLKPFYS